jgi:hypothetical protein
MGPTRSIESGQKRILATELPAGGWYIATTDGRTHASTTLSAEEFAHLFTRGAPAGTMRREG